jgi:hypothetical protein
MAKMTNAQLQTQLEALQEQLADAQARAADAEAAAASAEAAAEAAAASAPPAIQSDAAPAPRPRGRRRAGWAVLSVVCIVLAAVLAPIALVASWAGSVLTDTDRFVSTYAPIIDDPGVQEFIAAQTTTAITEAVDIEGIVGSAFDGIADTIGLPTAAAGALGMLQGAAVEAIESLLDQTVRTIVTSDAFSAVWEQALRTSHTQLVASLSGDPAALVQLSDDGVVGVQIGPIVEEVRERLIAEGVGLASLIPDIDTTIVIVQSDALPAVRVAYAVAVAASVALPIVSLVLLAAGVVAARRRSNGLIGAGLALAIPMAVVVAAIGVTGGAIGLIVPVSMVPESVSSLLFWTVAGQMRDVAVAILVLGIAIALLAWFVGSSRAATRLRGAVDAAFGAARGFGASHGLDTGRVGRVLHEQRWLVRALIAVVAGIVIVFVRPLTVGLVIGTVVVALLVLVIAELLRRPEVEAADDAADAAPPADEAADAAPPVDEATDAAADAAPPADDEDALVAS